MNKQEPHDGSFDGEYQDQLQPPETVFDHGTGVLWYGVLEKIRDRSWGDSESTDPVVLKTLATLEQHPPRSGGCSGSSQDCFSGG